MENNIILPIVLQLVGIAVIIAEIFLPSGGVLSVIASLLFGYSLYLVFSDISTTAGVAFVTFDLILIPVLVITGLKLIAKSPVTLRKNLSSKEGVTSQAKGLEKYLNELGTAVTDLRPAGIAFIGKKRVDVVTRGDYIEKGTEIIVVEVTGNQIIVREK